MIGLYTADEVRAAEEPVLAATPEGALMQRAATGLATVCGRLLGSVYGRQVALLVGTGNNGGDALFAGAHLAGRGARVTAVLLDPDRAHGPGLVALRRSGGRVVAAGEEGVDDLVARADLVLDGMLGIGGRGGLRRDAVELTWAAADGAGITVAVDVPSGIDASTGEVDGVAFPAMHTVTFGAVKRGLVVGEGRGHAGQVHLIDIGLGPHLPAATAWQLTDADVAARLEPPSAGDDKYSQGVVGVVAGSATYPGAGVLCTGAALRTRPGLVRYAGGAADGVRAAWPEAIVTEGRPSEAGRVQAWVVGPGMGTDDAAREALAEVLDSDVPVLVDADALTLLARNPALVRGRSAPTLLTPHDREFERFVDARGGGAGGHGVGGDRIAAARTLAADLGAVVLLKGDATVVADPDGTTFVNGTGTAWLATAGTGDVLSGIAGAVLATQGTTGLSTAAAAAVAAHLHGLAGRLAARTGPLVAGDLVRCLPEAIGRVRGLLPPGLEDSGA
ncbi:bifunctional ADP-dependent NAD(P)H-hydrate dehydratase/NAD(P)H-hydrate epimerase [Candidatus Blastococcus massiliensis]|uniref:bifunctional ADP-dependent NAD(P)H-hydrate dehydratase/NAD(P)H-hydrate epimerase n=1 Tax=Candidatus Blastococcus massiliensis TaxID=1470358 RepID=UPI0004BC22C8|nr:bifunctional ADP-dependent NAD(P)H-hydrate dehydratase/NAD(P)H-hydrate epimerase [Candidatus Blastococcus massiliensis]